MLQTEFRNQMPVAQKWIYLDHSAVGPLPKPTSDAISSWLQSATNDGDVNWPDWLRLVTDLRTGAARLINSQPDEIALVPSTTAGINFVAEGYPWTSGDNVVTLANEFPSNLFPWQHLADRGVETRLVDVVGGRVDPQRIDDACDNRTRIVSASWVGYASGWRINPREIAEIAHRNGALFFLDAIQGMGVFPLDVQDSEIDFLAADGHKWMLGPEGAGIFFMRREHLNLLRPMGVGWNSVERSFDFASSKLELKPSAARYEGGTMNMAGFIGLGASLNLLSSLGLAHDQSTIAESVIEVTDYAVGRLKENGIDIFSPRCDGNQSGVVTFQLPGKNPESVRTRCREFGIVLSCRGGGVRMSPHGYISQNDVDRLIEILIHEL